MEYIIWLSVYTVDIIKYNGENRIGGVMVSMLASGTLDCGCEPRSGQAKDYEIGICYFSAKHEALRRKSKDWLAWNQNNVSKWSDMSIMDCCFSKLAL
jgi:hypothetical protein